MSNWIKFKAPEVILNDKEITPTPIKTEVPEWFKKLDGTKDLVKNCMPFMDTLTNGYALKLPADLEIIFNDKETGETSLRCPYMHNPVFTQKHGININDKESVHLRHQLEGSPILNKNNNQTIQKIVYPFTIITPPGYSCLFLPPMNNTDDRFSIIPGIVETDKYFFETNFPFVLNGDKYNTMHTTLKKGLVFAQVIPFKRESWKMKLEQFTKKEMKEKDNWFVKFLSKFKHKYKNTAWSKKNFS
jgi:hypothetical protein|tara:strand:- start:5651 stop:6385 length:735 start_codon:yes stop_codon:yes gene_type:complete